MMSYGEHNDTNVGLFADLMIDLHPIRIQFTASCLTVGSNIQDSNTHDFSEGTRFALATLVSIEVVVCVDPDLISLCDWTQHGAGRHLLDVLLAVSGVWTVTLSLLY